MTEEVIFLKTETLFYPDGQLYPTAFWWDDGRRFEISKVYDVCPVSSTKTGGSGMRYLCLVKNRQVNLYYDGERWYMKRERQQDYRQSVAKYYDDEC